MSNIRRTQTQANKKEREGKHFSLKHLHTKESCSNISTHLLPLLFSDSATTTEAPVKHQTRHDKPLLLCCVVFSKTTMSSSSRSLINRAVPFITSRIRENSRLMIISRRGRCYSSSSTEPLSEPQSSSSSESIQMTDNFVRVWIYLFFAEILIVFFIIRFLIVVLCFFGLFGFANDRIVFGLI